MPRENPIDFAEFIRPTLPGYNPPQPGGPNLQLPPRLPPSPRRNNGQNGQLPSNFFMSGQSGGGVGAGSFQFGGPRDLPLDQPRQTIGQRFNERALPINRDPRVLADLLASNNGQLPADSGFDITDPLSALYSNAFLGTSANDNIRNTSRLALEGYTRPEDVALEAQRILQSETFPGGQRGLLPDGRGTGGDPRFTNTRFAMAGGDPLEGQGRQEQALGSSPHPNVVDNARAIQEFNELEEMRSQIDTSTEDGQLFADLIDQQLQELRDVFIGNTDDPSSEFFIDGEVPSLPELYNRIFPSYRGAPINESGEDIVGDGRSTIGRFVGEAIAERDRLADGRTQRINPDAALGRLSTIRNHLQNALGPDIASSARELRADLGLGEFSETVQRQRALDAQIEQVNTSFSRLGRFGSPEHIQALREAEESAFLGPNRRTLSEETDRLGEVLGDESMSFQNFIRTITPRRPRSQFDRR